MAEETHPQNQLERAGEAPLADIEEFNILELEDRLEFTSMMDDFDISCTSNTNCGQSCVPAPIKPGS